MQKTLAKINLGAIRRNALRFKNYTKVKLCAVVKADAYGHGAEQVVCALDGVADLFAVATIDEGSAVKIAACFTDVLVLTPPVDEAEACALAREDLSFTVCDLVTARLAVQAGKRTNKIVKVHLKTNTGMNRYGMNASMLGKVCKYLQASGQVRVEGLYSHLFNLKKAERSLRLFERHRKVFLRYFPQGICHLSATGGCLLGQEYAFDMVRVGLGLYGYLPDGANAPFSLEKVMRVYARVTASRKYAFGGAGYGAFSKGEEAKQAGLRVLRAGYADGFLRDGKKSVFGDGQANDLCMDACMLIGKGKRGRYEEILSDAAASARRAGTIVYETLCAATRRAEIEYVYE